MLEDTEQLQYRLVANDKNPLSAQQLIEFKAIISKALPNMEKSHIIRLLFDPRHFSLIMFKGNQIVGGTCFACFSDLGFVELAFLAVKADKRIQGYGKKIMNKTKSIVQQKKIQYIITYGDNMALGFFRKQGFSQKITMPKTQWQGFIKQYDGGKLMQCKIHPTVDYMQIDRIIAIQKLHLRQMVKNVSSNQVRFQGSKIQDDFEGECRRGEKNEELFRRDPRNIPGVIEAGWKWQEHDTIKKYFIEPFQTRCTKLIESIKRHPQSKYFYDPISPAEVPKYHDIIKNPMSLSVISQKIHQKWYKHEEDLCSDIELIFYNCRTFNSETSVYYKSGEKLKMIIKPEIQAFQNGMISTNSQQPKSTDEITN